MKKLMKVLKPSMNDLSTLIDILKKNARNNIIVNIKTIDTLEKQIVKKFGSIPEEINDAKEMQYSSY